MFKKLIPFLSLMLVLTIVAAAAASCKGKTPTAATPPPVANPNPAPAPTPTTGSVSGIVTDSATGAALSGATVSAGGKTATTGADGRYTIADIALGATTVTVQRQGHRNISQSVTVVAGTTTSNVAIMPAIVAGFAGTWTGTWTDTTFGTTGSATMTVTPDTPAQTLLVSLDLNGGLFGVGDPPAETQTIPYTTVGGSYSGTSAFYGTVMVSGNAAGMLTGSLTDVPGGSISRVDFTAMITPQTLTGASVVRFASGLNANSTMTLTKQGGLTTSAFIAQRLLVRIHELYALGAAWVPSAN